MANTKKYEKLTDEDKKARVDAAIQTVVDTFENNTAPAIIAKMLFESADNPCAKWSPMNQLIVGAHNSADARTYKQWLSVERQVNKGSHAFQIFAPIIKKDTKENADGEEVDRVRLLGWKTQNVFRVEDTSGAELPKPDLDIKSLPFIERAEEWNISVTAEGFGDLTRLLSGSRAYGVYRHFSDISSDATTKEEIVLATPDEATFLHELSHAAQTRLPIQRIPRERANLYEVVAEFSAAVLAELSGIGSQSIGGSLQYIKHYAAEDKIDLTKALNMVLLDVQGCVGLVAGDSLQKAVTLEEHTSLEVEQASIQPSRSRMSRI